jgi:multicomponent Na+:H+ antiporter subunit G
LSAVDWISAVLVLTGAFFFLAGTAGLLRFPDVYTRLHALTKADNAGLGFVVVGLLLQANSVGTALQLILIWLLVLVAGATAAYLVAGEALRSGTRPWTKP